MITTDFDKVRQLLNDAPRPSVNPYATLFAAAFAAVSAVTLAGVMVVGAGVSFPDPTEVTQAR